MAMNMGWDTQSPTARAVAQGLIDDFCGLSAPLTWDSVASEGETESMFTMTYLNDTPGGVEYVVTVTKGTST